MYIYLYICISIYVQKIYVYQRISIFPSIHPSIHPSMASSLSTLRSPYHIIMCVYICIYTIIFKITNISASNMYFVDTGILYTA